MQKVSLKRIKWKKCIAIFLCIYAVICIIDGCFDIYNLKVKEKVVAQQIEEANKENELWQNKVDEMSSPEALERIARERLGLVLPGEVSLKKSESKNDATN